VKKPLSDTGNMNLPTSLPRMRQLAPFAAVLLGAVVAVASCLQAFHFPFVSDDLVYVAANTKLAGLHLSELWRLLTEPYNPMEFLPLRDLSYWFDIKLFGLNPAAFRAHNIILYLLCLPLVYGTTLGLWRYFRPADADAPWAAAAVTALFALHPAHVEAVVWISGRKDVLSGLFSLLALWLAVQAKREQGISPRYAMATLFALLAAMLSKATAVAVAPVIAMLWLIFWRDIPKQGRRYSQLLWPFASLLLAALLALVFTASSSVKEPVNFGIETITRALAVLGWLVRLAVSPESRHFFYPVLEASYLSVIVALGVAVLAIAAVSAVMILLKRKLLEGFAILALLLLCIPYMQLIPYVSLSLVSDRFLFLSLWSVLLLLVILAWRLPAVPRGVALLVFALLWIVQTVERPRDWQSLETLIDADVRAYPGYYESAAYKIVGYQLPQKLHREAFETANNITERDARDIMIELIKADYAVQVTTASTGNPQEAMTQLGKLERDFNPPAQIKWNPAMKSFWKKVGFGLTIEWEYLAKQFPDAAPVRHNAGLWLLKVHKYKEAVVHLRAATESPSLPESARGTALKNLGLALIGAGDVAAAEAPLRAALAQSPPDFRAYCALSEVYRRSGRLEEAARAQADCRNRAPAEGIAQ
jgi:tetratricopeptide (TPR) repeat protein